MNSPRYLRPHPKVKVKETISFSLLEFLREVHSKIEEADKATLIPSDDLLQSGNACGGLILGTRDLYSFTYFPKEDTRTTWVFDLTADEIGDFAWGVRDVIELWSCANPKCGNRFFYEDNTCTACDWMGGEAALSLSPEEILEAERLRTERLEKHKARIIELASRDPDFKRAMDRFRARSDEQVRAPNP